MTRYPKIRERLPPAVAGRLVNDLRALAIMVDKLSLVDTSPDPDDNYLLGLAAAGEADFLVTGDKRDLLGLGVYRGTKIITVGTSWPSMGGSHEGRYGVVRSEKRTFVAGCVAAIQPSADTLPISADAVCR